jgi:hypothetical protein
VKPRVQTPVLPKILEEREKRKHFICEAHFEAYLLRDNGKIGIALY